MGYRTVSFRCSDEMYKVLLNIAHSKTLSVSDVIRQAILAYIEKEMGSG